MFVIGAGMAGLLAAAMLRNECETIIESQPNLPNNHSAVLRFRSPIVGDTLNIPFKKVQVLKAVLPNANPIADMMLYSFKTNGSYRLRSPVSARGELEERYIAPPDLIQQMAERIMCNCEFDTDFDDVWVEALASESFAISTIPMPVLMKILDWKERPAFASVPGYNVSFDVPDCDAYVSLYVPHPAMEFSRLSITGDRVIIECQCPGKDMDFINEKMSEHKAQMVEHACRLLGNIPIPTDWEIKAQRYSKILPIDDGLRKRFIMWATEEHRIFSLGRFATWRPSLLLDDLVKDVRVILDISRNGTYAYRR